MAVTGRMLRVSRPLGLGIPSSSLNSNGKSTLRSLGKAEETKKENNGASIKGEMKLKVVAKAAVASGTTLVSIEQQTKNKYDLRSLVAAVVDAVLRISRSAVKQKTWKQQIQMMIEKGVIDCRFFSLFADAGSLIGSILCFVEGCFVIVESYFVYFQTISEKSDQGHVMQLLIEAIDMFLLGSAMLIFGMGLYVMFVGARNLNRGNRGLVTGSSLFGLFHLEGLPACIGMNSVSQAKSKIGHAILMILQVGVLEKFKNVPLVTGVDLACFGGAILISSACVFLLSKLSGGGSEI